MSDWRHLAPAAAACTSPQTTTRSSYPTPSAEDVTRDCLAYALRAGVEHGIWAGQDAAELVRLRQGAS